MNLEFTAFDYENLFRIVLILLSSYFIGLNRGKHHQFAGVKAHIFVGLGAGISFLVPYIMMHEYQNFNIDPYRMPAQVISGIGFLGAGSIIKSGQTIRGLTTAATLWLTAVISITFASGAYIVGAFSAILVIVFLFFNQQFEMARKFSIKVLVITIEDETDNLEMLDQYLKEHSSLRGSLEILDHKYVEGKHIAQIKYEIIHYQNEMRTYELIRNLSKFNYISRIESITDMERL